MIKLTIILFFVFAGCWVGCTSDDSTTASSSGGLATAGAAGAGASSTSAGGHSAGMAGAGGASLPDAMGGAASGAPGFGDGGTSGVGAGGTGGGMGTGSESVICQAPHDGMCGSELWAVPSLRLDQERGCKNSETVGCVSPGVQVGTAGICWVDVAGNLYYADQIFPCFWGKSRTCTPDELAQFKGVGACP